MAHDILTAALLMPLILVVLPICLYLASLSVASLLWRSRRVETSGSLRRFAILVPAHDEESVISRLLDSIRALDYPVDRADTWVVADNCTDATASKARLSGAIVRERHDLTLRGKGQALQWLLEAMEREGHRYDAYIILDADSTISPNFLRALDVRLSAGSRLLQGYYTVLHVRGTSAERLREAALALVHFVRPAAKLALHLSCGLKGNGMCFDRAVIEQFGWPTAGLAEDVEAHLMLVRAGYRVDFVPEAVVRAEMPPSVRAATSQQERWEAGRLATVRRQALPLLWEGLRSRSATKVDAAIEQLVPPISLPAAIALLSLILGIATGATAVWVVALALLAVLASHLVVGLLLARTPPRTYAALVHLAPYIGWKTLLYIRALARRGERAWIRTERMAADG